VRAGHPAVVLDRSAFYPTGGGQPHDLGLLGGVGVVEVVEREVDGAVVHVLERAPAGQRLEGEVDWQRRFDLMQQHTGQHILSAASLALLGATTVGFHLADGSATVDLDRAPLSVEQLAQVELLINKVVFENRPVVSRFVPDEEVAALPLRKPVHHAGPVRIVQVEGFDCSACGGTHVRATGEVGLVKVVRSERRGAETRLEFLCGYRALADYAVKNSLLAGLAQEFSVGQLDLPAAVRGLAEDLKGAQRQVSDLRDALLDAEAEGLWHGALQAGEQRVVRAHPAGRTPDDLKRLAQRLIGRPGTVALLATGHTAEEKAALVFARSAEIDLDMGALLRAACQGMGGRGGGRPEFAQGGGPRGDGVAQALDEALHTVRERLA